MFMVRQLLAVAILLLAPTSRASPGDGGRQEILAVADAFRLSIIEKEEKTFLSLFLHDRVSWQQAVSDEQYALARTRSPDAAKVAIDPQRTPASFIAGIARTPARIEETFENIRVDTDGAAASLAFDFRFLRNGEVRNEGREYWLLLKTETGWKIASVVWSRHTPP
jgi:hypothetical protein